MVSINEVHKEGRRFQFIISEIGKTYVYFKRCTLEAKHEYNFNTNAHRVEALNENMSKEGLNKMFPKAAVIQMPSIELDNYIFDFILNQEKT